MRDEKRTEKQGANPERADHGGHGETEDTEEGKAASSSGFGRPEIGPLQSIGETGKKGGVETPHSKALGHQSPATNQQSRDTSH